MKHSIITATTTTTTSTTTGNKVTASSIRFISTITQQEHMSNNNNSRNCSNKQKKKTNANTGSSSSTRWLTNNKDNNNKDTGSSNNKQQQSDIWTSTNYTEERQRIREFWLQLTEEERRSLVKVEKEAVLRKMKEQQRHSCNCTVCGKKRTAIEDELEVLYDAYYEELEQYAYRQQQQLQQSGAKYTIKCKNTKNHHFRRSGGNYKQIQHHHSEDGDDDYEDDEDEDDDYRSDTTKSVHSDPDLSNTLTVKGSIITVADDLLKNDGKKFLDMMERLAERKMKKEREVASNNSSLHDVTDEEENDDEGDDHDEDDDEDEDDEDDEDDENDEDDEEEDSRTEEQRMEEGRKMFQVFAARMFEQRVLTAYREKVAQDRQKRLIEELEEEDRQRQEKELKKQQDKEKKKDKKRQLKLQQEQERLELENKKKQEELAAKADRDRKLEKERKIKEQERLKREEEKRQKQEDRLRKEEEKKKRLLKEQEAKAAEKERKRKEEEERQQKRKEEQQKKKAATVAATAAVVAAASAASNAAAVVAEEDTNVHTNIPSSSPASEEKKENDPPHHQHHHVLTDSKTAITPIGQRRTSLAGPIGSPVRSRSVHHHHNQYIANDSETQHSFFSNFLFGQPVRDNQQQHQQSELFNANRRVSSDGSNLRWSNGWTPLTALSDNVHGKLFGDVLATDRNAIILERARTAYLKLDEMAQSKFFMVPSCHTLDQVHRMIHDLYFDFAIDIRELYEVMNHFPASGLKCYYNQPQQCYIVQFSNNNNGSGIMPIRSTSSLLPTNNNMMISPPQPQHSQLSPTATNASSVYQNTIL